MQRKLLRHLQLPDFLELNFLRKSLTLEVMISGNKLNVTLTILIQNTKSYPSLNHLLIYFSDNDPHMNQVEKAHRKASLMMDSGVLNNSNNSFNNTNSSCNNFSNSGTGNSSVSPFSNNNGNGSSLFPSFVNDPLESVGKSNFFLLVKFYCMKSW